MRASRQQGMVLPFMLILLAMLTLLAGKIYALAEQQRGSTRALVQRSQATTLMVSMETIVLRNLPTLNLRLFQRLQGNPVTEPLHMTFPLPQGMADVTLRSAQTCLNLAPLEEADPVEKHLTQTLLSQLAARAGIPAGQLSTQLLDGDNLSTLPAGLLSTLCYLPGAGQHWDRLQLSGQHLALLQAALPGESDVSLRRLLRQGLTLADQERINTRMGYPLLVSDSHYYWLDFTLEQTAGPFRGRTLLKTDDRRAFVIRRRLIDDDALRN